MVKPQRPDLAPTGAVPEANLPGHHPDHEQDKPQGPPPRPRARPLKDTPASVEGEATATITDLTAAKREPPPQPAPIKASFAFDFEPRLRPFSFAFGVTPWTTGVDVADGELRVRFGPWSLTTPVDNIEGAQVTGPYSLVKVVGPARLSFADRGLTFATSTRKGVCIRFKRPVAALFPRSFLKHPGLTVTVDDPDGLTEVLNARQ